LVSVKECLEIIKIISSERKRERGVGGGGERDKIDKKDNITLVYYDNHVRFAMKRSMMLGFRQMELPPRSFAEFNIVRLTRSGVFNQTPPVACGQP